MAAPVIANSSPVPNGNNSNSGHERKPSVNIASGASNQMPNGVATPSSNRMSINFGQMNAGSSSPAIAHSTPAQTPQSASLSAPRADPRVTSPSSSPSPIPLPTTSGGRPPTTLPTQGNGLNFGGMSGTPDADSGRQMSNGPQGAPIMPGSQHYRRTSSQSQHSDMNAGGPPGAGRGFIPGAGRGRNYGGYQQQTYSPQQHFRTMPGQPARPGPGVPPHFQSQMHMGPPGGSPHQPPRSPAMPGSQPGTPHMQHMAMNGQHYMPNYNQFQQQMQPGPGQFAPQPGFDPNYQYYGQPYQMHPQYLHQGAPPSPRTFNQMPPGGRPSFGQGQFQSPSIAMSRTSSAMSERPTSSIGHPGQSTTPAPSQPSHTPSQSASAIVPPPSSNNFVRPNREKKAIVIRKPDGEVVTFDKKPATPVKAPSPAPPATTATPPPRPDSTASHRRTESKTGKTAEEVKAEFQEKVRRNQAGEKAVEEEKAVDDSKPDAAGTPPAEPIPVAAEVKAEPEKAEPAGETEDERKKREADEEFERMIAEMEAKEKEDEEREKAYQEKKQREKAEQAAREKEDAAKADDEMKRMEREAEAAEEAREEKRKAADAESEDLFAKLKKPALGPGAEASSGAATPASEASPTITPAKPVTSKPKPAPLKVETNKAVEPPEPTPGMQSLRTARLLQLQSEAATFYPEGIKSPNPAANSNGKRAGRIYDKDFLLQFQSVFKEKPVVNWDQKLKETLGDPTDSAGPKSGRTPSTMGSSKGRGGSQAGFPAMGNFAASSRTLPPGTTSAERFAAANNGRGLPGPIGAFAGGRPPSFPTMGQMPANRIPGQPAKSNTRTISRNNNESRGGHPRGQKNNEQANKAMPLTAGQAVKQLEQSQTGWKPTSVGRPAIANEISDQMAPDVVQRKVKAALNKMTPERFDKLSDEILRIAAQSKNESDGRTLRQVIALTFEKACDEAHWASMYAKFCSRMLSDMTNDVKDDNVLDKNGQAVVGGALFRKYLLNRCQEEFERGWQSELPEKPEGQTEEAAMLSDEYYAAAAVKRKGLGLVQFIGELYKLQMLSIKIMHECFRRLLDFEGLPDETMIESLTKLLRTVGETMEKSGPQGLSLVNAYFERIEKVMNMPGIPSRSHFMLLDMLDLRKSGWKDNGDKGPKTIQQIHAEAEAAHQAAELEKARQNSRRPQGRGDGRGFSNGPMPPVETRNLVGADEFRKLRDRGNASRTASGAGSSGPGGRLGSSGLGPRTASGRLGPSTMLNRTSDSGTSSRRDSQKGEKDDDKSKTSLNSFGALANLEDGEDPISSPPVTKAQPVAGVGSNESGTAEERADAS